MNARENPFASGYMDALRYRFLDTDMEQLLQRLTQFNYKTAIIGPHGSGKTTLLEQLGRILANKGFRLIHLRFNNQNRKVTKGMIQKIKGEWTDRCAVLVDGVEQLSIFTFNRLYFNIRNAGGVIVTSHSPCRFPTLITTKTTPELLKKLVDELLGKSDMLSESETHRLFHKHSGNIRDALREMYDQWAEKR